MKDIHCHNCGKPGQVKKYCKFLNKKEGNNEDMEDKDTLAVTSCEYMILSTCYEASLVSSLREGLDWVIDTSASYYGTPRLVFFNSYNQC